MTDVFDYTSPYGTLGRIADYLFLEKYMTNLLAERNRIVKIFAEDNSRYSELLNISPKF